MIERGSERDDAKDEVWFKISMHLPNTPIPQSVHGSNILSEVGRRSFLLCDAFIHKDNVVNSNEIFSCPRARQLPHAWKNLRVHMAQQVYDCATSLCHLLMSGNIDCAHYQPVLIIYCLPPTRHLIGKP